MERKLVWVGLLFFSCWGCNEPASTEERTLERTVADTVPATDHPTPVINPAASKPVNNLSIAEETKFIARNPAHQKLVEQYRQSMNLIDNTYKTNVSHIELYMKLAGKKKPVRVKNFDNAPRSLEISYNVYRDQDGVIRYVLASPFSQSNDWLNTFAHYFDETGQTIAFVRTSNFFNSGCTSEAASEISAYFFDRDQQLIQKMYELKDAQGNSLNPDSCVFNYRNTYEIFSHRDTLQQRIGIR